MNPDSEKFERLQKLMALKRYEQPPPRYFQTFSGQVMSRIKAGESAGEGLGWMQQLRSLFETKPMLTGAFGAAVCALVISGIVFSEEIEPASGPLRSTAGLPLGGSSMEPVALGQSDHSQFLANTGGVSSALSSLLNGSSLSVQPAAAGFGFPGGN
jgi:hypothetical protein